MTTVAGDTVTGSLSADGTGTSFQPIANEPFNVFLTGTFSATLTLKRSYDGGTTWLSVPLPDITTAAAFTAPVNFVCEEPQAGVLYAWVMSSRVSGTADYRFQQ